MKQALHILRKDVRYLWKEILFYLCLTGIFTLMWHLEWPGDLLELVGLYIVARVMHAESIPGDRQFWLTRPYRPMSLLGAKLLFIFAFLCLPLVLAQATVAVLLGFPLTAAIPGLVWTQVLILFIAVLPMAALATVTDNLLVFVSVILVLAVVGLLGPSSLPAILPNLFPQMPPSVSWMGEAVFGAAIGGASAAVLVWQYANRCTWFSRMFAVAAFYIAMLVYLCFPPGFSLRAEAGLSGRAEAASAIRIWLDPHGGRDAPRREKGRAGKVTAHFPLALVLDGIPRDAEVRSDDISVNFVWPQAAWKPVGRVGGRDSHGRVRPVDCGGLDSDGRGAVRADALESVDRAGSGVADSVRRSAGAHDFAGKGACQRAGGAAVLHGRVRRCYRDDLPFAFSLAEQAGVGSVPGRRSGVLEQSGFVFAFSGRAESDPD